LKALSFSKSENTQAIEKLSNLAKHFKFSLLLPAALAATTTSVYAFLESSERESISALAPIKM